MLNVIGTLSVTFHPEPNSFAFVNGLAVVSVPAHLGGNVTGIPSAPMTVNIAPNAVQTMYRLNVGGSPVTPSNNL
jgi:hypothetical protein